MARGHVGVPDDVYDYLVRFGVREPEILARLREETRRHPRGMMQVPREEGAFLALLAELVGARGYLEIGTFTGYSSLAVALALPPDGRIVCCDISHEFTSIARRYWAEAGVADKVDLRVGPAVDTLDALIADSEGSFDMAFIDADKGSYLAYYERCLILVRPGGLILVDNTLWSGDVADPSKQEPDTVALRAFNDALHRDERIDLALLPVGDGLTLARKR
jgi:predicted O-methyltransferase YrrM